MRILLVTNKTLNRKGIKRFDSGYYNTYVPLLELGHQVYFYDSAGPQKESLRDAIDRFQPDLIFSCITGDASLTPFEDIPTIEEETKRGNIKTFNWFCDDTWRFDNFSSKMCWKFNYCSTPQPSYVEKYKQIGYNNILLGMWHTNVDLYPVEQKILDFSFCGSPNLQRAAIYTNLQTIVGNNFHYMTGASYEDMLSLYARSYIGLNFSKNENDPQKKTQLKQRMVEIPAAKCMLLTEHAADIEFFFENEKEMVTFRSEQELYDKIKYFRTNPDHAIKIAIKGYIRFMKEHQSKIRLAKLLEQIK